MTHLAGPCDAGTATSTEDGAKGSDTGTLVATVLGSSIAFVTGSVINVALPEIEVALDTDAAGAQWVINAYLLPLGALVLIGGAMGDHYGRRKLFSLGLALFGGASVLCALAPTLSVLLLGRAIQGVGAAMLVPGSLAILGATFSGPAKGKAIGTWAAASAISGGLGPVLGGWLIDNYSWRALFWA
ncbi:MAG: MFS transporter, partial [Pacificimonas sp.]